MGKFSMKKSHSRSFCMCFDPDSDESGLAVRETERHERVEPVVSNSMGVNEKHDKDVVASFSRKKKPTRRSFSRCFKAIFFETSLMKKIRNQKSGQKHNRTEKSKPLSKKLSNSKSMDNNTTSCSEDYDSKSSTLSSSLSTNSGTTTTNSSSSSTSAAATTTTTAVTSRCSSLSESVENCMQVKVGNCGNNSKGFNGFNVAIWSFFISLLVLVFWGKVCAIFCTSTWLFFAYRWTGIKPVQSGKIAVVDPIAEIVGTELYKKKVIMEGLLERNHCQNRPLALLKQCC